MDPEERCTELAVFKRYWPGSEPDLVCVEHAGDSRKISEAMGFLLVMEPIGYSVNDPPPAEFPICCCSKGHPQKVAVGPPDPESVSKGERG